MKSKKINRNMKRHGAILIVAMIFLVAFVTLSASVMTISSANAKVAANHQQSNRAMNAALSGLESARYLISNTSTIDTGYNYISDSDSDVIWANLCSKVQITSLDGAAVSTIQAVTDGTGTGQQIQTDPISFGDNSESFSLRFYRYNDSKSTIKVESTGQSSGLSRTVSLDFTITKDNEVMNYAIASRGRMWITGDCTIDGDVYSSWDYERISPFNMTSDSSVLGTINTVIDKDVIAEQNYHLETLDEDGNPMFDEYGDRIYSDDDEIQGSHDGINYGQDNDGQMPGMSISDYNTDMYLNDVCYSSSGNGDIPSSSTKVTEYFPHASGNYSYPRDGSPQYTSNLKLTRHVYTNQTFTDACLPNDRNALFKNCTFEGVLYIDCSKSVSWYYNNYNNVRFEDCTFNGIIITDVPQQLKWQQNCLYFTGEATFENNSDIQEATILAPGFNVNLGNTNPDQADNNVLTGAIVGGIVDVRGNAQINGTIISMWDTTCYTSGYVTNIGATLDDGGSETTEAGDIGTILISPDEDKMLPSGISTPIVIKPIDGTYTESI